MSDHGMLFLKNGAGQLMPFFENSIKTEWWALLSKIIATTNAKINSPKTKTRIQAFIVNPKYKSGRVRSNSNTRKPRFNGTKRGILLIKKTTVNNNPKPNQK